MKHIGMFWMHSGKLRLDAEGIGRYCVRLAEGLLRRQGDARVSIVTNSINYFDVTRTFSAVQAVFPERLAIISNDNLNWVNRNVNVDMWIVPYVGLEQALHLAKPYVVCIHDLVYVHFPEALPRTQIALLDALVRKLADKAAVAVFNSNYIRDCDGICYLGLPAAKTRVIRPAPPVEEYKAFGLRDENKFRQEYHLQTDYIVYPSAIRSYKNHDNLIKAFFHFKQTGEGKKSQICLVLTDRLKRPSLQGAIRKLETQCNRVGIYFIDRLPSQDMPSLYKYSIGTVVPTQFEGACSFPILESLMMERPVAFSRLEVVKELIPNWENFITFDPDSVEDIQRGIYDLYHADPCLSFQQKTAIGKVLSRTWQDVAADYYELLAQLT